MSDVKCNGCGEIITLTTLIERAKKGVPCPDCEGTSYAPITPEEVAHEDGD